MTLEVTLSTGWAIFGCQPSLSPWPHLGFIDRNPQTFSRCAAFPSSGLMEAWIPPPDVRVPLCPTLICPAFCCRKRDLFQNPRVGSCLTLEKWIFRGDTCADKARDFIGKGTWMESRRAREPRRTALPCGSQSRFYDDGIRFHVVSGQSFWFRVLPGASHITQPRWIPANRILGDWQDMWTGVSSLLLTFPEFFQLVVSLLFPHSLPGPPVWDNSFQ